MFEILERELTAQALAAARGKAPLERFMAGCAAYLDFAERGDFSRIVMIAKTQNIASITGCSGL